MAVLLPLVYCASTIAGMPEILREQLSDIERMSSELQAKVSAQLLESLPDLKICGPAVGADVCGLS